MMATVWIVYQYASTPETGMGGRHFYIAEELAKLGHSVYVIASSANHLLIEPPKMKQKFHIERIAGFNFVWVKMPEYEGAHSKQRVVNWFLFSIKIQNLASFIPEKPDAILCSSPSPVAFLGAEKLAKKFKAKLLFEVRDIWPLTLVKLGGFSHNHPFIRMMQWIEDRAYRKSDAVVSNLRNAVEHMVAHGLARDKFSWISNGFSLREVCEGNTIDAETAAQIPCDKFIVGYAGTFGLANDLYSLIDAAKLIEEHLDILIVLVGEGRERKALEDYIAENSIKNVQLLGFIPKPKIQSMLSKFDVLAIGAKGDPLYKYGVSPNKLFDYLYARKPIIYHLDSGDYNPVKDAGCGFEVMPENPSHIAEAILKLYEMTKEEREQMGRNGRETAIKQYEYGFLANKLAKVLFD
ncbi:glycosyltransferase family 4 protein [Salinivibrio sp. IB872]|uniref:glycosyltransferase family 4 protein n=1 Tax=Salinivibrio sp. IB872 TaxID=1766123 RepID=UPI000986F3F2|nr:glycosyltransferase family 4 protein [Salinivibrio sp. IB872]OOF21163.1 glycosyltransferase WbuB [Salinivibrio sp. IB872]